MTATVMRLGFLPALLLGLVVQAKAEEAELKIPLYPEILVGTDDSLSSGGELAAFRAAVDRASKALVRTAEGEVYDPTAMLPYLADEIEIFVGQQWPEIGGEFVIKGSFPALEALQTVGNLTQPEPGRPEVEQRRGMSVVAQLLWDPVIGRTPWLDGRICTASYGRLDPRAFATLVAETEISPQDWLVAGRKGNAELDGKSIDGSWPKPYQLVPISPEQRRDGGWVGILTPEGGTIHYRSWPWQPRFAPYLNSHLCFERKSDGWKITAVALRLA